MQLLRWIAAAGGAVFAVLVVAGLAVSPGPASAGGKAVVEYYAAHGAAPLWQAGLVGVGVVCFVWFVGALTAWLRSGPAVPVSAAAMATLYLLAIGCWETLGENFAGADLAGVTSERYGDAHVLFDVGIGATHLANFMDAAFVGATAAALLAAAPPHRRLGRVGLGLAAVCLVNAPLQIAATSAWSDAVGAVVFLAVLAWVFGLSVLLLRSSARTGVAGRRTARTGDPSHA
jgi:hypothetical protein